MAGTSHVIGLDAGTTGVTALALDVGGRVLKRVYQEFPQHFPQPGWVEHDALEIWGAVREVLAALYAGEAIAPQDAVALGITNQRETVVAWDPKTSRPAGRALVWQDRRSAAICKKWRDAGLEDEVRTRTGLLLDPYFSASKLRWWIDNGLRPEGLLVGTIDSWLLWKLSGHAVHGTDHTNAARTLLFNIHTLDWDPELLKLFRLPRAWLPKTHPSNASFGTLRGVPPLPDGLPIHGIAGDQHAALFGQCCFETGDWKSTYGTGCFLMLHTGETPVRSERLVTTLACSLDARPVYALEGSVFTAGAAVQWLRDGLGLVQDGAECERLAAQCDDSGGVYLVPAFTGLGAPHWQAEARGAILGLSRGSGRAEICRAALEAMAYQTHDVFDAMRSDVEATNTALRFGPLRVDGGAARNDLLMQFQADLLGLEVDRPDDVETTARGVAYLAGLGTGFWAEPGVLTKARHTERRFMPRFDTKKRETLLAGWRRAVARILDA